MGFQDKRTISRTNGSIYAAWGLADTTTDEKVARTRAAIIYQNRRLIHWDDEGRPSGDGFRGQLGPLDGHMSGIPLLDWVALTPLLI